ncbi:MAG: glycosyl transferase [Rhodospirillaceae bacterium]|nr:glycosyl transferase [Rhodospirillaceae bacterium]
MKVLQAMAGAEFGGAEEFFVRLAIALNDLDIQQRVVIRENKTRARRLRAGGIEPTELRFGGMLDVISPWKMKRELTEFEPDIVLTWMNRATKICPIDDNFIHVGRLGGYYNLKYYEHCDHLIANTQDIADYLVKNGWEANNVHYLPNFVGAKIAKPLSREDFFTPDGAALILALGRLHENKAFDVLLEAISRVPNVYLWLAGEGPERANLEDLAQKLGIKPRVRFLGWREDSEALFATADVFVCPSRHEPLGNVVLEAWAQGVPVLAADSLGPGTLIEQGKTGLLVPIDDPPALAKSLKLMLEDEDLRGELARNGQAAYGDSYTEQTVVDKYMAFFAKLISS